MNIGDDSLYCPPLPLWWAGRKRADTPAASLHAAYAREMWRARGVAGRVVLALRFLGWPIIVGGAVACMTWRNGAAIARRTGRSVPQQIADQISVAVRHGILPPWYYMFELHRPENMARAGEYLHRFETKYNLYTIIKTELEGTDGRLLADKERFAALCAEHGVAAPPLVAVVENGATRRPLHAKGGDATPVRFVDDDLFIKPRKGKGGRGTLRASRTADGRYALSDGQTLTGSELARYLETLSLEKPLLVQRRLSNHPDMVDMCANALCCVRVLTCRNESDAPELTNVAFRMALRSDTTVDGLHRGGIAANVDIETGVLGPATNLGLTPDVGWCTHNPGTGVPIAGRTLPHWPETRALALKAHAMLPHKVMVGWDIAITDKGPVVVEGNGAPCVDIIQRVTCDPLGSARFGELLAWQVDRALAARNRTSGEAASSL